MLQPIPATVIHQLLDRTVLEKMTGIPQLLFRDDIDVLCAMCLPARFFVPILGSAHSFGDLPALLQDGKPGVRGC